MWNFFVVLYCFVWWKYCDWDWEYVYQTYASSKHVWYVVGKPLWRLIIEQFDDLLVKILLLAAIISFVSDVFVLIEAVHLIFPSRAEALHCSWVGGWLAMLQCPTGWVLLFFLHFNSNYNSNSNSALSLWEFARFIWWVQLKCQAAADLLDQANRPEPHIRLNWQL